MKDNGHITVLVLDDEELVRTNIVAFFEDEGFEVLASESGEAALEMVKSRHVDIAIVDMRLPGIDGNSFIIKAHEIQPGTRYMIHTGSINYTLPRELVAIGVKSADILRKPDTGLVTMLEKARELLGRS